MPRRLRPPQCRRSNSVPHDRRLCIYFSELASGDLAVQLRPAIFRTAVYSVGYLAGVCIDNIERHDEHKFNPGVYVFTGNVTVTAFAVSTAAAASRSNCRDRNITASTDRRPT